MFVGKLAATGARHVPEGAVAALEVVVNEAIADGRHVSCFSFDE
jgi:hypothetical protein